MLKRFLTLKTLLILIIIVQNTSCSKQIECPYDQIEWGENLTIHKEKYFSETALNLGGKLSTYFRKVGKGEIELKTKAELNKLSEKITTLEVDLDSNYIKRWNTLVNDICGKLALMKDPSFSDMARRKLEGQILERVEFFYETIINVKEEEKTEKIDTSNNENDQKNTFSPKNRGSRKIEVSIGLDEYLKGAKIVFVDNEKASILPNTTSRNLRLAIDSNPSKTQKILIQTNSLDTCLIERVFDYKQFEGLAIKRLVPNCTKH